jgi:hypothetical protein
VEGSLWFVNSGFRHVINRNRGNFEKVKEVRVGFHAKTINKYDLHNSIYVFSASYIKYEFNI